MRFGMVPTPVCIWPAVHSLLDPLVRASEETWPDLMFEVEAGLAQLWIGHEGERVDVALVTRLKGSTLLVDYAAATATPDWHAILATLEEAARQQGCKRVQIEGRRGWERLFKDYKPVRVTLEREL